MPLYLVIVCVNEFTVDSSKLCVAWDVMDAMLNSEFRESSQNQLTIDHVQAKSLRYFLHNVEYNFYNRV